MTKITKDMPVMQALQYADKQKMVEILQGYGMHCLGCVLAHNETIEQAAGVHGADVDKLLDELNAIVVE